MNLSPTASREQRRKRTRSLIQLGGLVEKSGLLETFELSLGADFQHDLETKHQIAALYKGLLILDAMARSEETHLPLWGQEGLAELMRRNVERKGSR